MKVVLCIGGSDPSSGAGIQVDSLATLAHGVFPLTAITSLTSQNSQGVYDLYIPEPINLRSQIEVLFNDYKIDAIKIGVLGNSDNVKVVAGLLRNININHIVLDPIIKSSSDFDLLDSNGLKTLKEELIPLTSIITPNIKEAEMLSDTKITDKKTMELASNKLINLNNKSCIITGANFDSKKSTDLLNNDKDINFFDEERLDKELRGTGCIFSTSLASNLAKGLNLKESTKKAKEFTGNAIKKGLQIGKGHPQITEF